MDLVKGNVAIGCQKSKAVTYLSKEEAFNLNEAMEDIAYILQQRGEVNLHEVRSEDNKVRVLGEISFSILYESASLERHLAGYNNRMSFEEEINIDGLALGDDISLQVNIEELKIEIVNSRKVRANALVSLMVAAEELDEEEILTDVESNDNALQTKKNRLNFLNKCSHIKDNIKLEGDVSLSSGQENIGKMIWYNILPYNVDFIMQEGQISVVGELHLFAVYQSEDGIKTEYIQETIPFSKGISAENSKENVMLNGRFNCSSLDAEIQQDLDGEDRGLHINCSMDVDICLYRENSVEYVEDVYSVKEEIIPETSMITCQKFLSQNISKCRLDEMVDIKSNKDGALQLLCSNGKIKSVKQSQENAGVLVDGILEISGMYIASNDERPYEKFEAVVPFEHFVEIPNMDIQSEYQLDIRLDQLSVTMAGDGEIEVKALILVAVLAYDIVLYPVILDLKKEEMNRDVMKKIPGITGYVVKEDDSLWDIAKRYMTTIDELKEINELKSEQLQAGNTIIIVKSVGLEFDSENIL